MKRRLTSRELILLGLLLVVAVIGGYLLLYYMPMTTELERLGNEKVVCEEELEAAQLKIADKRRMERELDEIFAANPNPLSIAPYDNLQPVLFELNAILQSATEYSLSFGTVTTDQNIVRRRIALSFVSDSYATAERILGQLHDSAYRCMLDDVSITLGEQDRRQVSVDAVLLFFEYQ